MCNTEQQKEKIAEWMFQAIREYYMKKCTFPNDKLHHPELAGKPMAVGGDPEARHGIVLTANYIAKRAGVKTGMALWQARQVCPEIIFVPPRMDLYYILTGIDAGFQLMESKVIFQRQRQEVQKFTTLKI